MSTNAGAILLAATLLVQTSERARNVGWKQSNKPDAKFWRASSFDDDVSGCRSSVSSKPSFCLKNKNVEPSVTCQHWASYRATWLLFFGIFFQTSCTLTMELKGTVGFYVKHQHKQCEIFAECCMLLHLRQKSHDFLISAVRKADYP